MQKHLWENGNVIYGDLNRQTNSKINFRGKDNILFLGKQATLSSADINFMGNNALIFIGDSCFKGKILIFTNCLCYIGNALGQSAANMSLNITSESYCIIGNDCLFSWGICIENSDHHPIFDCQTHTCLNVSHRNCLIGDHVWVGQWAWILKNTFLASGSIMGAKAVATKTYYSNTANVGIPAKQTRKGVFWNGSLIKDSTKEKIKQLEKVQTDNFKFIYQKDSFLSPKSIEAKLESLQSAQEKLEFVYDYLYCNTNKNRFAYFENCPFEIPLPSMTKQFKKLNFEIIKSPKLTPQVAPAPNPLQERITHLESILFGTATTRIQNHLNYQLGQILIQDSKSLFGISKLPFKILLTILKHKNK
uniref:acyltransferase n=1 Tax=Helicobacter rodentium TaxID=59617 RepID=UPI00068B8D71